MKHVTFFLCVLYATLCIAKAPKVTKEDFKRIFAGKILSANQRGSISLGYDFTTEAQCKDFTGEFNRSVNELCINGNLFTSETITWMKPHFTGNILLDCIIKGNNNPCAFYLFFDDLTGEGYVFLIGFGEYHEKYNAVARFKRGKDPDIIYRGRGSNLDKTKYYKLKITKSGSTLQMSLNNRVMIKTKDKSYQSGQVGFSGNLRIKQIKVQGTLNPRWFQKILDTSSGESAEDASSNVKVDLDSAFKPRKRFPEWPETYKKESDHYIVMSNVSQKFTDYYSRCAEMMHRMYSKIFPFERKVDVKSHIVLFKTKAGFMKFGANPNCIGFYVPAFRNLYLFDHVKPELAQEVLLHEGFHQYIHLLIKDPPIWFNEGMAEYFETAKLSNSSFRVGNLSLRLNHLNDLIDAGRIKPMQEFMKITTEQFQERSASSRNYSQAWGMCHFFIHYRNGIYKKKLQAYFMALFDGMNHEEAFDKAFTRLNWRALEEQWHAYIQTLARKNG